MIWEDWRLLFAATGPITNASDGVEGEVFGTCVNPAEQSTVLHECARDELTARERMREVSAVQALQTAVFMDLHLQQWNRG